MAIVKQNRQTHSDVRSFLDHHAGSDCDVLVSSTATKKLVTLRRVGDVGMILLILNTALLIASMIYDSGGEAKKQLADQTPVAEQKAQQADKQYKQRSASLGRAVGRKLHKLTEPHFRNEELKDITDPAPEAKALRSGRFETIETNQGEVCRSPMKADEVVMRGGKVYGANIVGFCRKTTPDNSQARFIIDLDRDAQPPHKESFREAMRYTERFEHTAMKDGTPHSLRGYERNDLNVTNLTIDEGRIIVTAKDQYGSDEQETYHLARLRHTLTERVKPGIRAHYRAAYDWLSSNDQHNFKQLADNTVNPDCDDCQWSPDRYSVLPASAIADRFSSSALAIEVHDLPVRTTKLEDVFSFKKLNLNRRQYLPHYRGGTYRLIFDTLDD